MFFLVVAGECAVLLPVETGSSLLLSGDPGIESSLCGEGGRQVTNWLRLGRRACLPPNTRSQG